MIYLHNLLIMVIMVIGAYSFPSVLPLFSPFSQIMAEKFGHRVARKLCHLDGLGNSDLLPKRHHHLDLAGGLLYWTSVCIQYYGQKLSLLIYI